MKMLKLAIGIVLVIFTCSSLPARAADPLQQGATMVKDAISALLPEVAQPEQEDETVTETASPDSPQPVSTKASSQTPATRIDEVRPHLHVFGVSAHAPAGYSPAQMRRAYGFDLLSGDGTGQTIAIVDAYGSPTVQADLNVFCATYGIPTTTINIVYPTGVPTTTDTGWAMETALDVEWAHAIAPGATIMLVVAKDASWANMLAAVDYAVTNGASQVSMSFGALETADSVGYNRHFEANNVTFTASTGDNSENVAFPASSPNVVAVGGTTLHLDGTGNRISETAWKDGGGGVSQRFQMPGYQAAFYDAYGVYDFSKHRWYHYATARSHPTWYNGYNSTVTTTNSFRQVPDISYNADPATGVAVYYKGAWNVVGGTSAGAPQWAALFALVNSARSTAINIPNNALYQLGAPDVRASYFNDILTGQNGGGFSATNGYDQVTGMGTPISNNLIPALITK